MSSCGLVACFPDSTLYVSSRFSSRRAEPLPKIPPNLGDLYLLCCMVAYFLARTLLVTDGANQIPLATFVDGGPSCQSRCKKRGMKTRVCAFANTRTNDTHQHTSHTNVHAVCFAFTCVPMSLCTQNTTLQHTCRPYW